MSMMFDINLALTGSLEEDIIEFLITRGYPDIAQHSKHVAKIAVSLAARFRVDVEQARLAGLLHDVGRVITDDQKVEACHQASISVLPEELEYVGILHQKLAPVLAREVFGCNDETVLTSIGCHTTLRAKATDLDKVLFLADKLSWEDTEFAFQSAIVNALDTSLDAAAVAYIEWVLASKPRVVHPWLREGYESLRG